LASQTRNSERLETKWHPARFWPAPGITIEEWSTHTVISYQSRYFSLYEPLWRLCRAPFQEWKHLPVTLWSHTFGCQTNGPPAGGALEVALHENVIKCWGHGRRFQGVLAVKPENVFITIPLLDELELKQYQVPTEEGPFMQAYTHVDARGYGWALNIKDLLSWYDSERPARLYWRTEAAQRHAYDLSSDSGPT
jgi:hypothetical protein